MAYRSTLLITAAFLAFAIVPANAKTDAGTTPAKASDPQCAKTADEDTEALSKFRDVQKDKEKLQKAVDTFLSANPESDVCISAMLTPKDEAIAKALARVTAQKLSDIAPAAGDDDSGPAEETAPVEEDTTLPEPQEPERFIDTGPGDDVTPPEEEIKTKPPEEEQPPQEEVPPEEEETPPQEQPQEQPPT